MHIDYLESREEKGSKRGTNTLSRKARRKLPTMPWMSQPRPQLLAHFICVWRVFCQPARRVFDGNVPTVQAVTRSHFTKATVRPNRAVCESEQKEGHERFYVWCYILKTPSGREALELICYALCGNMKKKLRGVFDYRCLYLTPLSTTSLEPGCNKQQPKTFLCSFIL